MEHDAEARATIEITIPHRTLDAIAETVAELPKPLREAAEKL